MDVNLSILSHSLPAHCCSAPGPHYRALCQFPLAHHTLTIRCLLQQGCPRAVTFYLSFKSNCGVKSPYCGNMAHQQRKKASTSCHFKWDFSLVPQLRLNNFYLLCEANTTTLAPPQHSIDNPQPDNCRLARKADSLSEGIYFYPFGSFWGRILGFFSVGGRHLAVFLPKPCFADPEC